MCLTSHWAKISLIWILSVVVSHTFSVSLVLAALKPPNSTMHILSADDAFLVGFSYKARRSLLVRVVKCLEVSQLLQIVLSDIDWRFQSFLLFSCLLQGLKGFEN